MGERVHAIIGGFHLTGDYFSPIIERTVGEMKDIAPKVILPSHCTGIRALIKLANALADSFIENSVGTFFGFRILAVTKQHKRLKLNVSLTVVSKATFNSRRTS